jgi:ATP-dependent DNA ligase
LCTTAKFAVDWQLRVKSPHYRVAALPSASHQSTDIRCGRACAAGDFLYTPIPVLAFAFLAGFIAPCLPTNPSKPPSGEEWLHEIKHDRFRVIARKEARGRGLPMH